MTIPLFSQESGWTKRWDRIKGCSLARITLSDPGKMTLDDQEKPTFTSRISDWPMSRTKRVCSVSLGLHLPT